MVRFSGIEPKANFSKHFMHMLVIIDDNGELVAKFILPIYNNVHFEVGSLFSQKVSMFIKFPSGVLVRDLLLDRCPLSRFLFNN